MFESLAIWGFPKMGYPKTYPKKDSILLKKRQQGHPHIVGNPPPPPFWTIWVDPKSQGLMQSASTPHAGINASLSVWVFKGGEGGGWGFWSHRLLGLEGIRVWAV